MWMRLFTIVVVLFVYAAIADAQEKNPRTGERDDDHGNLEWISSAERSNKDPDDWIYTRTVRNRDDERRCRVRWKIEATEHRSLIEPMTSQTLSKITIGMPPEEAEGNLFYNGGRVAGEAEADAPAWVPKGSAGKVARLLAEGEMSFEWKGSVVSPTVRAQSSIVKKGDAVSLEHVLRVAGHKKLPKVGVRWTSLEAAVFVEEFSAAGRIDRQTKQLRLEDGVFRVGYTIGARPVLRNGVIQFVGEGGRVLAATWLPAFGPAD